MRLLRIYEKSNKKNLSEIEIEFLHQIDQHSCSCLHFTDFEHNYNYLRPKTLSVRTRARTVITGSINPENFDMMGVS